MTGRDESDQVPQSTGAAWAETFGCLGLAAIAAVFVLALVWLCMGAPR